GQNGTQGHGGTGPQGRTVGETGTAAAVAGRPETVSAVAESITRIPALKGGEYVKVEVLINGIRYG
ncbi:hypothetical protein, partial [Trichothermofontia sp.]